MAASLGDRVALLDWKRRIFELYAEVREAAEPPAAWSHWRGARDRLFSTHPQSPIPPRRRADFEGVPFFDYDPRLRVTGEVVDALPEHYEIATSDGTSYGFDRIGRVIFSLGGDPYALELYWLSGYGGGLFLPFRDATAGRETYGAGRYLLDTVKGADLGMEGDRLVLDFNFAYNPSCSYDPRWVCPLAPPPNRLDLEIRAGERAADAVR